MKPRWLLTALLLIALPASSRAAGLVVLDAGLTVQDQGAQPFLGGVFKLDLGHDFRAVRVSGEFRLAAASAVTNPPDLAGAPHFIFVDLTWGPALEVRLNRWVRIGAASLFGLIEMREVGYSGAYGTFWDAAALWQPLLWLSADLWHDRYGHGALLTVEGNVDVGIGREHGTGSPVTLGYDRAGATLYFGYRI